MTTPGLKTILVVDDNVLYHKVITILLKKRQYIVPLYAMNGKEAIDMLNNNDVTLILMDINMPVMNGLDCSFAIRQGSAGTRHISVPIIAFTTEDVTELDHLFNAACINGTLAKPFALAELDDLIIKYLPEPVIAGF